MQLVILAAGHGRRFGGLKQLAPVGPHGEAIMDYTALAADSCGFAGVVLVIREEIRAEVVEHVRHRWPASLDVEFVCQPPLPGTAQAVLCASPVVDGPFGVANADDLYGEAALRLVAEHFSRTERAAGSHPAPVADRHVLVAYQLLRTVLTSATVTRGLCELGADDTLERIAEHRVTLHDDGTFDGVPLDQAVAAESTPGLELDRVCLAGTEPVSMNLWGFHHRLFDELRAAVDTFDPAKAHRPELLLPDVVGALVTGGTDHVHVVGTTNRCIGITHREDIAIVADEVAEEGAHLAAVRAARS